MDKASKKLPEQSKSKNLAVKTVKERSKTYCFAGSVENSKKNVTRISTNGKEDLVGDNLEGGVVALVESKDVETEIEVKNGDYSENVQVSDSFDDAENEVAGDHGIGTNNGISLLVDVSSEMGREDSSYSNERENGDSLNEKRENLDGKIRELSDSEDGQEENSSDEECEFCVGDFVWGKIKSYPWWPGQIYDSSDASDYALKVKHRDGLLVAYFDGTFAWCHPSQLKPFEKNFEEMLKQSSSKNFVNAVQKAVDEIGRLVELRMTCSCVSKESLNELSRPLTTNSGIRPGVLVPEGGIAKLWNYLFGPADCLTELKHVSRDVSINNMLEFTELKCWLSSFYRVKGGYQLALYHEPQPIPGLEDNNHDMVFDLNRDAEFPIQGPAEEETNQSLLQKCLGDLENGSNQRRKQKTVAEIMEECVDTRAKNVEEDVGKEGTGLEDPVMSSSRKKRKNNDETIGGSDLSSRSKRRKVTKLLESNFAKGSDIPSVERDGSMAKEEKKKVLLSREKKKNKGSCIENDKGSKEETNTSLVPVEGKTVESDDVEAKEQIEKGFLSRERKKSKYLSPPYTSINRRQTKKDTTAESLKVSSEARLAERMSWASAKLIGSQSHRILMHSDGVLQEKDAGTEHEKSDNSITKTLKPDQSTTIHTKKVMASANAVLSGIRSTAIDLTSLENNTSPDMVEGFLSMFRSSIYCCGSNYKIYNKSQSNRKRNTLDSEPGLSAEHKNQSNQKSSEQSSQRTRIKKNKESKMMKVDSNQKSSEQRSRRTRIKKNEESNMMKDYSNQVSSEQRSRRTRVKKNEESKMMKDDEGKLGKPAHKHEARTPDMKTKDRGTDAQENKDKPKLEQVTRPQDKRRRDTGTDGKAAPGVNANDQETNGNASSASIFVTFGPASSLPSKNDLIKIYSKFGCLIEEATEMFYNNHCARVVFLRSSDAEEALKSSQLASPFGAAKANFELRNSSYTSKMWKLKEIRNAKPIPPNEGGKNLKKEPVSKSSVSGASPFSYVKQKLETIASVLEKCDGKMSPELKSKLEDEVKDLLEKVNKVDGSSSS